MDLSVTPSHCLLFWVFTEMTIRRAGMNYCFNHLKWFNQKNVCSYRSPKSYVRERQVCCSDIISQLNIANFPTVNHVDFWFVLTWSHLLCQVFFIFFAAVFDFNVCFDVLVERGSCVVIYMPYVTLESKVLEIRFQPPTGVCFLSTSRKREKGEWQHVENKMKLNLWKRLMWSR